MSITVIISVEVVSFMLKLLNHTNNIKQYSFIDLLCWKIIKYRYEFIIEEMYQVWAGFFWYITFYWFSQSESNIMKIRNFLWKEKKWLRWHEKYFVQFSMGVQICWKKTWHQMWATSKNRSKIEKNEENPHEFWKYSFSFILEVFSGKKVHENCSDFH